MLDIKTKIKDKFEDLSNHFPTPNLENIKYYFLGLLKRWGSAILMLIILFYTNILHFAYYTIQYKMYNKAIENNRQLILNKQERIREDSLKLECIENQLSRLTKNKNVSIGFCK